MQKDDVVLGMLVDYTRRYKRVINPTLEGTQKYWEPFDEPGGGIVVGMRYLQNGMSAWLGDDGRDWVYGSNQLVALVATSLWRDPVPVALETVTRRRTRMEQSIMDINNAFAGIKSWADAISYLSPPWMGSK